MTNYKIQINRESGFTLIELLVVISIIGILAALSVVSYTAAQKEARDVTRKSDLSQYRNSLEAYANKSNGLYPIFASRVDPSTNICSTLGLSTCPEDPKNGVDNRYYYSYITDAGGTNYVLWAKLENISTTTYWIVCSNGTSGKSSTTPSSGVCPI